MTAIRRAVPTVGGALLAVTLVAGCGGSTSTGPTSGGSAAAPTSSPSASDGRGFGGANSAQFAAIRSCLQAAGISIPTPSGRPSFTRSPGEPRPSRSPGQGGFRGGQGLFNNPQVRAALKACGITLPSPGSFRRPGASPTPTS